MVPLYERERPWPTLGPQLAHWMQTFLVHGPGDVRGEPYRLDAEKVGVLCRLYEVHPQGARKEGRRRFKRGGLSVRKGWAKTELGAAVAAGELHPDAPVRFSHWAEEGEESWWGYRYSAGEPVGRGVRDPYIPMVAYTEEQSEELAFGALSVMVAEGPLAGDFDVQADRILVIGENGRAAGKAEALAAAPDSRDGARTTFQLFDETHRQRSERLLHAHETMLANVPKRLAADAWTLEVTTAYEPGLGSVAERTHGYAKLIAEGKADDRLLFFYHREAGDQHVLRDERGRPDRAAMEAAVLEASGPAAAYTDVDYIVSLGLDPNVDPAYWERVWLNRIVASGRQFFPIKRWEELAVDRDGVPFGRVLPTIEDVTAGRLWLPDRGRVVTLGFDGSKSGDSTALVVTDVLLRRQAVVAVWEHPRAADGEPVEGWEVPIADVEDVVRDAFRRWDVALAYFDPYWWETQVSAWRGRFSTRRFGRRRLHRVIEWHTNRPRPMALSLRAFVGAIRAGEVTNNGDPRLRSHLANARRYDTGLVDEDRRPLETIRKERSDSPDKIDLAMAANLSWEACRDAVALGVRPRNRVPRTI